MNACPSCAAPLDTEGICTACGALSRGFFRGLDLGTPQVAAAVDRGLDFYQLLEVAADTDLRSIARRYRRLRALFPDDPRRLAAEPARRLALLELAGRVLTDPALRRTYDQLRAGDRQGLSERRAELGVIRCAACSAPLGVGVAVCVYCGTPRPQESQPPASIPDDEPPPADIVDYYAAIGLTAEHLGQSPAQTTIRWNDPDSMRVAATQVVRPPTSEEVDAAAYQRQQTVLMATRADPAERERQFQALEVARRILRDERRRPQYDALLMALGRGNLTRGGLEALHQMQEAVLAELREEQGQRPAAGQGAAVIRQAQGLIEAGVPREALPLLRKLLNDEPQQIAAHRLLVQATLMADDPLLLGGLTLSRLIESIDAAERAGQPIQGGAALRLLCQGLAAREAGRAPDADRLLRAAAQADQALAVAWRGLAALALARGDTKATIELARRAATIDQRDERPLVLIVAACLQTRRRDQAREAADQIARLRGAGWDAARVLREVGG